MLAVRLSAANAESMFATVLRASGHCHAGRIRSLVRSTCRSPRRCRLPSPACLVCSSRRVAARRTLTVDALPPPAAVCATCSLSTSGKTRPPCRCALLMQCGRFACVGGCGCVWMRTCVEGCVWRDVRVCEYRCVCECVSVCV